MTPFDLAKKYKSQLSCCINDKAKLQSLIDALREVQGDCNEAGYDLIYESPFTGLLESWVNYTFVLQWQVSGMQVIFTNSFDVASYPTIEDAIAAYNTFLPAGLVLSINEDNNFVLTVPTESACLGIDSFSTAVYNADTCTYYAVFSQAFLNNYSASIQRYDNEAHTGGSIINTYGTGGGTTANTLNQDFLGDSAESHSPDVLQISISSLDAFDVNVTVNGFDINTVGTSISDTGSAFLPGMESLCGQVLYFDAPEAVLLLFYETSNIGGQVDAVTDQDDVALNEIPNGYGSLPVLNAGEGAMFAVPLSVTSIKMHVNVPSSPGSSTIDFNALSAFLRTDSFGFSAGGGDGFVEFDVNLKFGFVVVTFVG